MIYRRQRKSECKIKSSHQNATKYYHNDDGIIIFLDVQTAVGTGLIAIKYRLEDIIINLVRTIARGSTGWDGRGTLAVK